MKFAEQFRCEIPSTDAIKEGAIYCSTNATNAIDIWVAVGTVGSTVVAAGLAVWTVADAAKRRNREDRIRRAQEESEIWRNREEVMLQEGDNVADAVNLFDENKPENLLSQALQLTTAVTRYCLRTGDFGEEEREFGKALTDLSQMLAMKIMNLTQHYELDEAIPPPSEFDLQVEFGFTLLGIKHFVRSSCIEMAQAKTRSEVSKRAAETVKTANKLTDKIERSL